MKKLLLPFIILLGLVGCNRPATPPFVSQRPSLVTDYYDIDTLVFESIYGWITGISPLPLIMVYAPWDYTAIYSYDDVGEKKEIFDALCVKNNDTTYPYGTNPANARLRYPIFDIIAVSIVSDADFDAGHPAGTLLNDIMMCELYSPYPHIMSGYKDSYEVHLTDEDSGTDLVVKSDIQRVRKLLSAFELSDFKLPGDLFLGTKPLNRFMSFDFTAGPTISKVHNITVTLTTDDGRTFEDTVLVSWE